MQNDNISIALTYVGNEPDIKTLRFAYEQTITELEAYFDLCAGHTSGTWEKSCFDDPIWT